MADYKIENDQGKVRLFISDVGGKDGKSFIFEDAEIQAFLDACGGVIDLAAARALRTIASNEAQVSKRIKFLDLSTDGPAVTKALRDTATDIEKAYKENLSEEEDGMEIADLNVGPFAEKKIIEKRLLE